MLRGRARSALALGAAAALLLALPALGHAATPVYVTAAGELRADDYLGDDDRIEIRFESAAQSGTTDRFVVENSAGAGPYNTACVAVSAQVVACDAAPVVSIGVGLGPGDDVLTVTAVGPTAVPSRYPVRAKGGDGNDGIKGAGGNDRLLGEAGRDIVAGGLGDDFLWGGTGADGLLGFDGDDVLAGGPGPDALFGQKGRDRLAGGPGNDVLLARDGTRDARIDCGPGARERAEVDHRDPRPRSCEGKRNRG